eukprot:scaffold103498_cov67-Phaeocystis_antarctica.AAC.4
MRLARGKVGVGAEAGARAGLGTWAEAGMQSGPGCSRCWPEHTSGTRVRLRGQGSAQRGVRFERGGGPEHSQNASMKSTNLSAISASSMSGNHCSAQVKQRVSSALVL